MFPFSKRKSQSAQPATGKQLAKRGLALGGGILLLWLALEIMPRPRIAEQPVTFPREPVPSTSSTPSSTQGTNNIPAGTANMEAAEPMLDLGQITAALLLAGLIGFAFYWQRKKAPQKLPAEALQAMGKLQLNPNQHIHLVGCGKDVLLVGTTSSQITLLHQFPLQELQPPSEEVALVQAGKAPQYSTPSTTNLETTDFGILLQHQSLLDPHSETAKSLAATSLDAN